MHAYGFVIVVADESIPEVEACLGFLRAAYPDAPVTVILDGPPAAGHLAACTRHHVTVIQGRFLKRTECGGRWWRRTLEAGLALDTTWIVKIDPDTRVWRPFDAAPLYAVAGTLDHRGTARENVLGGCQAILATAAARMLASGLLDDPAVASLETFVHGCDATRRSWTAAAWHGTDMTLAWLCRNLGIPCGDWPDVGIRYDGDAPDNRGLRYAATHPHKLATPPAFAGVPLRVITTCKGRREHLEQTLPTWLADPGVAVTVVDFDCPQGTADWVRATHPEAQVVRVRNAPEFHLARARNIGASFAPEGWWCFWDADLVAAPGWADAVRQSLRARRYLLAADPQWQQFGSVVVHSYDFRTAGGYDELIRGWGAEDGDFYTRLRHVGIRPGTFPQGYTTSIKHSDADRTRHYVEKDPKRSQRIYERYHTAKTRWLLDHSEDELPGRDVLAGFFAAAHAEFGAPCPPIDPAPDLTVSVESGTAAGPLHGSY